MEAKIQKYESLLSQLDALYDPELNALGNTSNILAAIQATFQHHWGGIYWANFEKERLELLLFQGPPACTIIPFSKGVCGQAFTQSKSIVVPNVHEHSGHIACSPLSNSEIVVPIIQNNVICGVLDIDSAHFNTFDNIDKQYLEKIATKIPKLLNLF